MTFERLGKPRQNNEPRPILATVTNSKARTNILKNSEKIRTAGRQFASFSLKKDSHQCIRLEWRRLFEAEKYEKRNPENNGYNIRLDIKARKLFKDDEVIDEWRLLNFSG